MSERSNLRIAAMAAITFAVYGCGDWGNLDFSPPQPHEQKGNVRFIDQVCANADACVVSGAAERTTAISADSIGFHFGDGGGKLEITLPQQSIPVDAANLYFDVLVAGHGSLHVYSTFLDSHVEVDGDDATWKTAMTIALDTDGSGPPGDAATDASSSPATYPSLKVTFETSDAASIDLVDLRVNWEIVPPQGCGY